MSAREAWRARLGLETGGPGWKVEGPPAPLSPEAELALLAIRQLRSELAAELVVLDAQLPRDPLEAKREAYRVAATPFDLASRKLRHRRRRVA